MPNRLRLALAQLVRMAAEEFQHVVFVKVFADHSQELAEALGVNAFPSIHLFAGPRATRVAKFTANMSAEGLARIRLFLSHWSHPDNSHADAVAARAGAEGVVLL